MNTAEIVICEVQGHGGFQVSQLLAESICQARESAKLHPHCEVLPFDVASRNVFRVRIASPHLGYNLDDWTWGIPPFGAVVLTIISEKFYQLREVRVQTKGIRNPGFVVEKSVCSDLHPIGDTTIQVRKESSGICLMALSHSER